MSNILNVIIAIGRTLLVLFASSVLLGAVLRYFFDAGSVQLQDLAQYSFSLLVLVSIMIAFFRDRHVRVNLPSKLSDVLKDRRFRIFGALGFFTIALVSMPTVMLSWSLMEGSKEPNGLGGVFLVKSALPLSFSMIGLYLIFSKGNCERNQ